MLVKGPQETRDDCLGKTFLLIYSQSSGTQTHNGHGFPLAKVPWAATEATKYENLIALNSQSGGCFYSGNLNALL